MGPRGLPRSGTSNVIVWRRLTSRIHHFHLIWPHEGANTACWFALWKSPSAVHVRRRMRLTENRRTIGGSSNTRETSHCVQLLPLTIDAYVCSPMQWVCMYLRQKRVRTAASSLFSAWPLCRLLLLEGRGAEQRPPNEQRQPQWLQSANRLFIIVAAAVLSGAPPPHFTTTPPTENAHLLRRVG